MNPSVTSSQPIRHRPAYQVNALLRRAGVTQFDIAAAVGCSQASVSAVILRRDVSADMAAKVWAEIERRLGGRA